MATVIPDSIITFKIHIAITRIPSIPHNGSKYKIQSNQPFNQLCINLGSPGQWTKPCFRAFREKRCIVTFKSFLLWGTEAEIAFGVIMWEGDGWRKSVEVFQSLAPNAGGGEEKKKKTSAGSFPGRSELKTKLKDMFQHKTMRTKEGSCLQRDAWRPQRRVH